MFCPVSSQRHPNEMSCHNDGSALKFSRFHRLVSFLRHTDYTAIHVGPVIVRIHLSFADSTQKINKWFRFRSMLTHLLRENSSIRQVGPHAPHVHLCY